MDAVRDDGHCPQLENAVGWALYAVEPAEEQAIRAHLPACPECRETVRYAEESGALLGTAVPQYLPPPDLRHRLLAAIHDAPRVSVTDDYRPPVSLDAVRQRRRSRVLLAAAAVVVVALGGATTVLGMQVGQLTGQQQARAAGDAMVRAVVEDPTAKRAVLTNAAGKPIAMLVTGPAGAVVVPLGLAPTGADEQYVAWGLRPSGPTPLATFDVTAGSVGPLLVNWPSSAHDLTRFALSREPGHTMPSTPTNVIASGSV
jgi:hypothetical protein